MKRMILSAAAAVCAMGAMAQTTVPSIAKEAVVYLRGAELTHEAKADLSAGVNELRIEGLSPAIDMGSLKIKTTDGVVVTSFEFSIDHLNASKELAPAVQRLKDQVEAKEQELAKVDLDLSINTRQGSYLTDGISKNVSGSESGLGMEELRRTIDYYKAKAIELETEKAMLTTKRKVVADQLAALQAQYREENTKGSKTSGVLRLMLSSPKAVDATFVVSYYTPGASWSPFYDINVPATDWPVQIIARAKVAQTTGLDWNKVRLTLSTSVPSNGKSAPELQPWFLQPYMPVTREMYDMVEEETVAIALQGSVAGIRIHGIGSINADSNPLILLDGVPITYEALQSLNENDIESIDVLKDSSATSIYGSRASNGVITVTSKSGRGANRQAFKNMAPAPRQETIEDYTSVSSNELNVTYDIDLPYSIPGSGKEQTIDLLTKTAKAGYKYYTVPKLDDRVYLVAEIPDWQQFQLLAGIANITYDGTYVGQTFLDAGSTDDKLRLTLGTDARIAVKRETVQEFSSRKMLGSTVLQQFTYRITVKNNQTRPIELVIEDQYPVSTQKDVKVTFDTKKNPGWHTSEEKAGQLSREERIAAGATGTYEIGYGVEYPRGMNLNL